MALTKNRIKEILSAAGVSAENAEKAITDILDGHLASVNALREERDNYKADADKLKDVQKELDDFKAKGDQDWQSKYENEHKAFDDYKKQIADQKVVEKKSELYKQLLKDSKIDEKRIAAIMKVTDLSKLKIKDDQLDGKDELEKSIKAEWADFIVKESKSGADVSNPPAGGNPPSDTPSRAAQLAKAYHDGLYGSEKKGE